MPKLPNAPRMLRARMDAKGRITVPKALRMQLGLMPGSQVLLRAAGEELHGIATPSLLRRLRGARQGLRRRLAEVDAERDD
ncbi:AbrB/MazE/SpoVT family DNA-binding domain-containing protein [Dankookia sp. GCM10030260]|uniref:AbrB/MazE/SpoVT family DNA-binding domain-containing protein n=1 Tax=Dankookia sp. GCM10030260 TaxID=3273390 RepID=UPI00360FA69E